MNRVCVGSGRSVSEPERVVHGDEAPALSGVTGVGASLDDGRCRWSPLRTVSGREKVTVFTRLALAEEDADASDDDCWPESVRETGIVIIAVVGTALGVVMVKPGLARVVVTTVETAEIFRRVVDVDLSVRDSEGRAGSGAGMVS